ncbi:hypothetical protein QVD17_02728 [Tagetes erecta]|uniref:Uncharacterized protein n=1 Tax=Tagetes erecta TaxID=13708 RepID=A0AAD8L9Z8_TARER|nr:hypothetical protein QVD17_02728 [Tagetes erecta]
MVVVKKNKTRVLESCVHLCLLVQCVYLIVDCRFSASELHACVNIELGRLFLTINININIIIIIFLVLLSLENMVVVDIHYSFIFYYYLELCVH